MCFTIGISLISAFDTQLMSTCMDATGTLNTGCIVFGILAVIGTVMILLTSNVDTAKITAK